MATKITTASTKSFAKIKSFLKREKVFFTTSLNNGVYTFFVRSLWLSLPERTTGNQHRVCLGKGMEKQGQTLSSYGRKQPYRGKSG